MKNKINNLLIDNFGVYNHINQSDDIRTDLHLDSLEQVELIMLIEKEFNIVITDNECEFLVKVEDLYNIVEKKTK